MAEAQKMNDPDTDWRIINPGILALPNTKMRIEYRHGHSSPYIVLWDGVQINIGLHSRLGDAKAAAAKHVADMIAIGHEP